MTLRFDEMANGSVAHVDVDGVPVAVVRIDDEVFAIHDKCSHGDVRLSDGIVWCETKQIECIRHSSVFNLETGVPETLPATQPVPVYDTRIVNGDVIVNVANANANANANGGAQ